MEETIDNVQFRSRLEHNIRIYKITACLMWMRFLLPVLALFYIASQVPIEQFAIIFAVFSVATLILEIPSGVVADLIGKKKTLLISRFCYIIEFILIIFFNGFWIFLVAKIISGIGVSLSSGTDSGLLYETLKKLGREPEHKKISGEVNTLVYISLAFVMIAGSILFSIAPKLPAIASLPFITIGFILTFLFVEPDPPVKDFNLKNFWNHFKEGVVMFKANSYLVYLASFTLMIGAVMSMILNISSDYYSKISIPVALIGFVAFFGSLLTALASKYAHKIEGKLHEEWSIFSIQILSVLAVMLMSFMFGIWGLVFLLLLQFIQGFYNVVINDYVNRHIVSSHRVTMLSINNMFDNIGIAIMFPILGFYIKSQTMGYALLGLALVMAVYLFVIDMVRKR